MKIERGTIFKFALETPTPHRIIAQISDKYPDRFYFTHNVWKPIEDSNKVLFTEEEALKYLKEYHWNTEDTFNVDEYLSICEGSTKALSKEEYTKFKSNLGML